MMGVSPKPKDNGSRARSK